jgi:acylphosphatase
MLQTISVIIKGKVQGVYFRHSSRVKAEGYGLKGTVKNLNDGSVEIIATGLPDQINQFTEWCKRGPRNAVVSSLEVTPLPLQLFPDFIIT